MSNAALTAIITAAALIVTLALAIVVIVLVRRRLIVGGDSTSAIERVLRAEGAARCMEAISLLRLLTGRAGAEDLTEVWFRIDAPLRAAIPDCPPPLRILLGQALLACAASCRQRAVAKAMTDLQKDLAG
jgi:hypothetical protein